MKPHNSTISVLIDKIAQEDRKSKIGSIILDQRYIAMTRNLQYGQILCVGDDVTGINVGDIALFHHSVEDNDMVLLESLPNGNEIRLVHPVPHKQDFNMSNKLYATITRGGVIKPYSNYVFLSNQIFYIEEPVSSDTLMLSEKSSKEAILNRQDEMTRYRKNLETSLKQSKQMARKEEIFREINNILEQQEKITYDMNTIKRAYAQVAYCGDETLKLNIKPGDQVIVEPDLLYPLNIMGLSFFLIKNNYIDGIIKN